MRRLWNGLRVRLASILIALHYAAFLMRPPKSRVKVMHVEVTQKPGPPSQRELAIQGFTKRYANLFVEGDYLMADYIADKAFECSQMTDEEFLVRYPNLIYQGE